jgi:serine/threonine-protein kinase HipA
MSKSLDVLVDGKLIGCLYDKDPLTFVYSDDCLNELLRSPFANVIPLESGDIATQAVLAYFENLLPEGDQRRSLEERHHVTSIFGLLSKAGWDTAGSIVMQPTGATPSRDGYVKQTWPGIAQIIAGHGTPKESSKASISGAQYKLLLSLDDGGNPLIPLGATASTHILKPDVQRLGQNIWASAVNETIMMRAAHKCGLPVASVDYIGAVKSCLVERYDRASENGKVVRLHQSDLCQLLKIPSGIKYEVDGGPTFAQCYSHVKSTSVNTIKDCESLLKWLFFNLYIGNNDSHAKNISMLFTGEGAKLAPFYDLMCTAVYAIFSSNFAFKIGGPFKPGDITSGELTAFSDSLNVSDRYMRTLAKEMSEKINPAIQDSIKELEGSFSHADKVMAERIGHEVGSICRKRKAKLLLSAASAVVPVNAAAAKKTRKT